MFGIGMTELVLILIFGFLIFGPDKLPEIAKTVAAALNKFRSAQAEMNKVIKTEVYDPNSDEPFKNPLDALSKVAGGDKEEKTENFSDRKAKYDKERAAKKRAAEQKARIEAARQKNMGTKKVASDSSENKEEAKPAEATKKETVKPEPKAKPSADELYGNVPKSAAKTAEKKDTNASAAKPATTKTPVKPEAKKGTPADAAVKAKEVATKPAKPAAKSTAKPAAKSTTKATAAKPAAKKPAAATPKKTTGTKSTAKKKTTTEEKGE